MGTYLDFSTILLIFVSGICALTLVLLYGACRRSGKRNTIFLVPTIFLNTVVLLVVLFNIEMDLKERRIERFILDCFDLLEAGEVPLISPHATTMQRERIDALRNTDFPFVTDLVYVADSGQGATFCAMWPPEYAILITVDEPHYFHPFSWELQPRLRDLCSVDIPVWSD